MIITEEQRKEFEEKARPLIKFLNDNFHPHVSVVIDCNRAQLFESIFSFTTDDYLKD